MRIHSLIAVCALAMGLASPAMAQQSVHRYVVFFKYGDNAVKAMTRRYGNRQPPITSGSVRCY